MFIKLRNKEYECSHIIIKIINQRNKTSYQQIWIIRNNIKLTISIINITFISTFAEIQDLPQ